MPDEVPEFTVRRSKIKLVTTNLQDILVNLQDGATADNHLMTEMINTMIHFLSEVCEAAKKKPEKPQTIDKIAEV